MSTDLLRVAAFVAYLAAWVVFGIGAVVGMTARRVGAAKISTLGTVGTLLQVAAAWVAVRSMTSGALRPQVWELIGMLVLAPASSWLFVWAQVPASRSGGELVTDGAYGWVRHPMYLAFLGMLVATGLAVSAGLWLVGACVLFLIGSEMRISVEEGELAKTRSYSEYRQKTRWRYLPGLR